MGELDLSQTRSAKLHGNCDLMESNRTTDDAIDRIIKQFKSVRLLTNAVKAPMDRNKVGSILNECVWPLLNIDCAAFIACNARGDIPVTISNYCCPDLKVELREYSLQKLISFAVENLPSLNPAACDGRGSNEDSLSETLIESDGSESFILVPVCQGARVIGGLACMATFCNAFAETDVAFLEACAASITSVPCIQSRAFVSVGGKEELQITGCDILKDIILEAALSLSVDLICAMDTSYALTYFNNAYDDCFFRHHGVHLRLGETFYSILAGSPVADQILSGWKRALANQPVLHERRTISYGGRSSVFSTSIAPLVDNGGMICGAVMVMRDITEHLAVGMQVKRSQELLQKSQKIAHLGSWEMDFLSGKLTWSDEMFVILNLDKQHDVPDLEHLLRKIHPDDTSKVQQCFRQFKSTGQSYSLDFRIVQNGETRWFCSMGSANFNETGNLSLLEGVLMDVTSRKHAEIQADKLRLQFTQFMDNPSILAWITTVDTNIEYINKPYASMFGLLPSDLVGKSGYDMFPEEQLQALIEHNKLVVSTGTSQELEETLTRPDGTLGTYLVQKFPITNGLGDTLVGGIAIDVTEQRVLHAELLQSQKMEGFGRLAGGIAHDFNNLLSVILGYAELVQESYDPLEVQASVTQIQKAAQRAAALTNQLLSFARKQIVSPSLVDVADVIDNTFTMLKPLIGEGITFTSQIEPSTGQVLIDRNQLEQVIVNLVVNARDAVGGRGTVKICVIPQHYSGPVRRPGFEIPAGNYAHVEVHDNGTGMSAETLAHMFEPFYTTKPSGKGTGLGLATVYGIIKQNHGYVWLDSKINQGTTATILLPLSDSVPVPAHPATPKVKPVTSAVIMVVEDEPVLRVLTVNALTVRGYKVVEATNGREAVNLIRDQHIQIDMLVTDANMPVMGGLELSRRLRQDIPGLPVIVATGYSEEVTSANSEVPVDTVFMLKPYTMAKLAAKIEEVLERHQK